MLEMLMGCYDWKFVPFQISQLMLYTPEDNQADFGSISPLLTILGNVRIILMNLKMIFSDLSEVWGVLRVTESATDR